MDGASGHGERLRTGCADHLGHEWQFPDRRTGLQWIGGRRPFQAARAERVPYCRDTLHPHKPGRRTGLQGRSVQHRGGRPVLHRRAGSGLGRLYLHRAAGAHPAAAGAGMRRSRRSGLGGHSRVSEGQDGRPRSDHHDYGELHRVPADRVSGQQPDERPQLRDPQDTQHRTRCRAVALLGNPAAPAEPAECARSRAGGGLRHLPAHTLDPGLAGNSPASHRARHASLGDDRGRSRRRPVRVPRSTDAHTDVVAVHGQQGPAETSVCCSRSVPPCSRGGCCTARPSDSS